jgi:rubredoxin
MTLPSPKRYRCRFCGFILPAWYPVPGEVNGA